MNWRAISPALFVGQLALASSAALAAATVDDEICLKCEDVLPAAVRDKHLGAKAPVESQRKCRLDCAVSAKPVSLVTATCGAREERLRGTPPLGRTTPIAALEDNAYARNLDGDFVVHFTDKDTPCSVFIHSDPHDATSEAKAVALARDIAKVLTPDVVARRRTVEALLWLQASSLDRANAALQAWAKDSDAMKRLASFAPGFPKVAASTQRPDWPAGTAGLVLGYCPNGKGEELSKYLKAALPGLEAQRVPAAGATLSCPVPSGGYDPTSLVNKSIPTAKGELSVVAFVVPGQGPPAGHQTLSLHAFLRDSSGRLLASHESEEPSDGSLGTLRLRKGGAGLVLETVVNISGYRSCKGDAKIKLTSQITVAGDKLTAENTLGPKPECMSLSAE